MQSLKYLLGSRIKEIRKIRNLKQYELASKVGVDAKYVSRIENGISSPSLETLQKFALALNVEPKELFDNGHFESKQRLILQITKILPKIDLKNLQFIHRFLHETCS